MWIWVRISHKVLAGAVVISSLNWGRHMSNFIHVVLSGLTTPTPRCISMGLSNRTALQLVAGFLKASNPRENVREHTCESHNLVSGMTAHYFCHSISLTIKSKLQPTLKGKRLHKGMNIKKQGLRSTIFENTYHKHLKEKLRNRVYCHSE